MEKPQIQRIRYQFFGMVQGVGFRYRAKSVAQLYDLTGWVDNLDDGSVVMEVQGPADKLALVVPGICRGSRWIEIQDMTERRLPPVEGERGFHTRGW
mgnify:CR=1 FL=1